MGCNRKVRLLVSELRGERKVPKYHFSELDSASRNRACGIPWYHGIFLPRYHVRTAVLPQYTAPKIPVADPRLKCKHAGARLTTLPD